LLFNKFNVFFSNVKFNVFSKLIEALPDDYNDGTFDNV